VIYTAPQLFFGLAIGAWTDRTDRKQLMIVVDLLSAVTIASVAIASGAGLLSLWWIYAVVFVSSTLSILLVAAEFGAIPSLVDSGELVSANGPIQASLAARVCARPARCRGTSRHRARRGGLAPRRRVIRRLGPAAVSDRPSISGRESSRTRRAIFHAKQ